MGAEVKAQPPARRLSFRETFRLISSLFKMRVVSLLVFASLGGAFLGERGVPPVTTLAVLLVTGMLAASGASAINQYIERDIDPSMRRTRNRPLANRQIHHPTVILGIALAMILIAVFSVLGSKPAMAFYLALGALIYVGVYTVWLKPRSVVNIVIGGAAGSCAVMTGGAAVGAASDPAVIVLALLIFLWTPAHFWALAMMYKDDYAAAHVPMLPVHTSQGSTAWWIFVHAVSTALAALALAVIPTLGLLYAIPTGIMTFLFLAGSIRLIRTPDRPHAIRLFITSNIFLALVLLAIVIAATGHQLISLPRV
jgi:protoheme IX farnesyltransferase